ncbi:MAG: OmpA family protein [Bacteroidota bacterium]
MPSLAPHQLQQIKNLLAQGQVRNAVDQLLNMLKEFPDAALVFEEVLVLSGELGQHEQSVRQGLTNDSIDNAISFRLLQILNTLDPSKQQNHQSRIDEIVSSLRQDMLKANMSQSPRDIQRLKLRIQNLTQQYPDNFELHELQQQISSSAASYIPPKPVSELKKSNNSRLRLFLPVLLMLIVAGVAFFSLQNNDIDPGPNQEVLIAAVIAPDNIQLEGIEPFMETEECKQLIAMAEEINEEKSYQASLSKSLQASSPPSNTTSLRVEGNYKELYERLYKERWAVRKQVDSLENRLIDSIQSTEFRFDYNSAELEGIGKETLEKISILLKENPEWQINISGHTDDIGSDAFNEELSRKRAENTSDYLQKIGVHKKQIKTSSYGEKRPKKPNATKESRKFNRRTELEIKRSSGEEEQ